MRKGIMALGLPLLLALICGAATASEIEWSNVTTASGWSINSNDTSVKITSPAESGIEAYDELKKYVVLRHKSGIASVRFADQVGNVTSGTDELSSMALSESYSSDGRPGLSDESILDAYAKSTFNGGAVLEISGNEYIYLSRLGLMLNVNKVDARFINIRPVAEGWIMDSRAYAVNGQPGDVEGAYFAAIAAADAAN